MVPFWATSPEVWDTLVLAGVSMPGVARVAVSRTRKLEIKGARGSDGAVYTITGYDPAEVSITLTMHTEAQFVEAVKILEALGPGVASAKKAKSLAVDISHPQTQLGAPISSIIIESVAHDMPDNGIFTLQIKAHEFLPAKEAKPRTPKAARPVKVPFERPNQPHLEPALINQLGVMPSSLGL